MKAKIESLIKTIAALENDLMEVKEELDYLVRTTKFNCTSSQRSRRYELEASRKDLKLRIESAEYSIAELQWNGGVTA